MIGSKWFELTFGFKESVTSVYNNINMEYNEADKSYYMINKITNEKILAGQFTTPSIDEIPKHSKRGGGTLNIIHGRGSQSSNYALIDVLSAQSVPEFDGATYLAASNFNCLEFVSPGQTASQGISDYQHDRTQGPYCAIACGPAILYRNYFHDAGHGRGQLKVPLNLLDKTPIRVRNGYAIVPKNDQKRLSSFDFTDLSKFKIGSHRNCAVTMTRSENQFIKTNGSAISHHVYAAAFNFAGDADETPFNFKISESLLEAEYKACILQAWDNSVTFPDRPGSKKLFLTLLGGGVFNNPLSMICEQIAKQTDLIVDSGLEVYVVCFTDYTFKDVYRYLGQSMKQTKGSVIEA